MERKEFERKLHLRPEDLSYETIDPESRGFLENVISLEIGRATFANQVIYIWTKPLSQPRGRTTRGVLYQCAVYRINRNP